MNYYRILTDDSRYADRWFLDEPRTAAGEELDAREFGYGKRYNGLSPAVVPIQQAGRPVAFNLAAFDMPVVSGQIANILDEFACDDIERFPVMIDTDIAGYEIINVTCQQNCIDESRARVRKWGPEDDRPDKLGHYRDVSPLVIDPLRTHGKHVFRIWGFIIMLIVSEEIKRGIERLPDLGIVFKPVTGENVS